ncbi:MAG: hypothetical protein AB8F74_12755 [Saprospiraceae bacterium]
MNNEDKNIDDKFRNAFEDFQVTPPMKNWEGIEEDVDSGIDEQFSQNLQSLEVVPKAHVWENIKEELPLHPEARRYFSWMNKVAAVLVIGMLLCILSDQQKQQFALNKEQVELNLTIDLQKENTAPITADNAANEFVYELSNHNTSGSRLSTLESEEEAEIKTLLRFILEDDEDFGQIDSAIVLKGFATASAPSEETATANLEEDNFLIPEFEIKIPLKVVETEQEADDLLRIYDSSQSSTKIID